MVDFARGRLVNVNVLADQAGVGMDTIRKWRREGLRCKQRGKTILTTWEEFNRFFNGEDIDAEAELAEEMALAERQ
jgi:phage terminase Nu1 subunit (DNA packaging protein)